MSTLIQDLKFGLRMLAKRPGFTAVAVLSLALGIGANSTVFSIVDTLTFRPWPVEDPGRIVMVATEWPKEPDFQGSSFPDYSDMRQQVSAFSDMVAFGDRGGFISGDARGLGQMVSVEVVSQNYFAELGVRAALGRAFSPQPEQAASEGRAVLLSHAFWRKYFGGDAGLLGRTTLLDGKEFTVIGVAAPDFGGLRRGGTPDIWVTKEGWETMVPGEDRTDAERDNRWFDVAGLLRPGAQVGAARAQLAGLAQRLAQASPATNQNVRFHAAPPSVDPADMQLDLYLLGMVGLVLLISCANVANLLLAQVEGRQREMAMRRALGAGEWRLVSQLLTEGLLLSLAGGVLGVLLAAWLMRSLPSLLPAFAGTGFSLDGRALLFTAAISLLTTVIFGLAPAWHAAQCDMIPALKGEGLGWGRLSRRLPLRNVLVGGEIALSVVLLTGSVLLLRSLIYSQGIGTGFNSRKNVVMLSVAPPGLYGYNDAQSAAVYRALAARAESVPGVVRASYARRAPLTADEAGETQAVDIPGVPPPPGAEHFKIRYNTVGPRFFTSIGARLVAGREFDAFDLPSKQPVVMINDAMARRFWPAQQPVGKSVRIGNKDLQIVGVVESGRYVNLHETVQPYIFLPFTQVFSFECVLFVETAADPRALVPTILKEMAEVDRHLPIVNAVSFREHMQEVLAPEISMARLLASLSILGMFLAAVGLYAAVAYHVSRRSHEIGIRMALGARRNDVYALVLSQGGRLAAVGAAIGVAGALAASRLMSQFVYGVRLTDPLSYTAATLGVVGLALLASYFPARRATRVDPLVALRHE
jgi:predicted permease